MRGKSDLVADVLEAPHPRQIIWWYFDAEGGVGKSTMCRNLVSNHGAIVQCGKKCDIHYAYNGERIAIFEIARAASEYIPYEAIEDIKNGMLFSEKYESGMKVFEIPHVVVFANCLAADGKFSDDRIDQRDSFPLTIDSDSE